MSGRKTSTNGTQWKASVACLVLATCLAFMRPALATAQTQYHNLDANLPLRVEDALPTERRSLDIELAPLRVEELVGGARRWRIDPKLSYGVAAFTEVGLPVPA